jgi:hypothetical protein
MPNPLRRKALKLASTATLALTASLFLAAAWIHGASSELLLEAGVFLVSVKLVISTEKSEIVVTELREKLDSLEAKLDALLRNQLGS